MSWGGRGKRNHGWYQKLKRMMDVVAVFASMPTTLPIGLLTAAVVSAGLGRPVLYRQPRMGRDEREFEILKFRTMTDETDSVGMPLPDSERLTGLGKALRKSSLDELPQLINVAKGEMSLVGPRPLFPRYLPYYTDEERIRHSVRPGITGRAQVFGRNALLWHNRLEHDVRYVEQLSFSQDALILWHTFLGVMKRSNIVAIAGESGEPLDVARGYPCIEGLTMRRFENADVPARVAWMNDERTREYMSLPNNVSHATTIAWLRRVRKTPGRYDFTVTRIGSDSPVAMLGLTPRDGEETPELYVFVDPDLHGCGVGSAAMKIVLEWMGRAESPHHACWLTVDLANERAIRLYNRLGFHLEGESRSHNHRVRMSWSSSRRQDTIS